MKAVIKAIIAGSVIIGIGLIVLIVALALNGWKFMPKFEMAEYVAEGEIGELKIDNAVGNVKTEFYDIVLRTSVVMYGSNISPGFTTSIHTTADWSSRL